MAASLCCIGPLLFVVLGLGTFGAGAVFETARPYLLAASVIFLAFSFYRVYFRREVTAAAATTININTLRTLCFRSLCNVDSTCPKYQLTAAGGNKLTPPAG